MEKHPVTLALEAAAKAIESAQRWHGAAQRKPAVWEGTGSLSRRSQGVLNREEDVRAEFCRLYVEDAQPRTQGHEHAIRVRYRIEEIVE